MSVPTIPEVSQASSHVDSTISPLDIFSFTENDSEEDKNIKMTLASNISPKESSEMCELFSQQHIDEEEHRRQPHPEDQLTSEQQQREPRNIQRETERKVSRRGSERSIALDIEEHELRKKGLFKKEIQRWSNKFVKVKKPSLLRSSGRLT